MDVSVIIVNYNTRELTMNCIQSVYDSETKYSYEIILVDNASSDDSVQEIRKRFPGMTVIENGQNVGFARANNQAAEKASGRYLYVLNSDTVIEKDVLERVVEYGDKNPDTGVIGTHVVFPDGKLYFNFYRFQTMLSELIFFAVGLIKSSNWSIFHLTKYRDFSLEEPFAVDVITGCSLFVKREVYDRIGLFNERFFMYYEDGEFCFRVWKEGYKCMYFPFVTITHIHMGTSKKNIDDFRHLVYCFESACIYLRSKNNRIYEKAFKVLCFSAWSTELVFLQVFYGITGKEKVRRKIKMLKALLKA